MASLAELDLGQCRLDYRKKNDALQTRTIALRGEAEGSGEARFFRFSVRDSTGVLRYRSICRILSGDSSVDWMMATVYRVPGQPDASWTPKGPSGARLRGWNARQLLAGSCDTSATGAQSAEGDPCEIDGLVVTTSPSPDWPSEEDLNPPYDSSEDGSGGSGSGGGSGNPYPGDDLACDEDYTPDCEWVDVSEWSTDEEIAFENALKVLESHGCSEMAANLRSLKIDNRNGIHSPRLILWRVRYTYGSSVIRKGHFDHDLNTFKFWSGANQQPTDNFNLPLTLAHEYQHWQMGRGTPHDQILQAAEPCAGIS